jgi:hypothetical protein
MVCLIRSILETIACREAFALADDFNISRVFAASDCKDVVADIHDDTLGENSAVIEEIKARSARFSAS